MKYKDWLNEWLEYYVKTTKKDRTYFKYKRIAYELDELSAPVLQRFVAKITDKYFPNTVMGVIVVIKNSLVVAQTRASLKSSFQRPSKDQKP